MASMAEQREMWLEVICTMVAEGQTLRDVSRHIGISAGHIIAIVASHPDSEKRYAAARDAAGDILEAEILEAARNVDDSTAKADRVKIDALKWVAARRAPKRYGDRVHQEISGPNGQPLEIGTAVLDALARKHVD